ncbi:UNVERIFIED_CONTAM: protein DOG1-like 4 [Sesamum angustifolium]|uniref:Protein DOG1-like 4 n=1 Tax=Sesamum angustifolium TaxID=2727405 RepID=A0AAW2P9J7_9LAMI
MGRGSNWAGNSDLQQLGPTNYLSVTDRSTGAFSPRPTSAHYFSSLTTCCLPLYILTPLSFPVRLSVHALCCLWCRESILSEGRDIVNKLTAHHKQYYTFKWAAAHEDVLAFFTPVWLSRLENAHLWVTGWKPSLAFRLVESLRNARPPAAAASLAGMTEEQVKKIEALRVKIKVEEERVEREMERQQVGMADRKMVELVRQERLAEKNGGAVEVAVRGMLGGLEKVMKMADCVRLKTLKGMLDVLTPTQCVHFLAANSMLQIQMRKMGEKER